MLCEQPPLCVVRLQELPTLSEMPECIHLRTFQVFLQYRPLLGRLVQCLGCLDSCDRSEVSNSERDKMAFHFRA